jgi:plastocyanin
METEKIFWAMAAIVAVGAAAFMAFGALASPVYAQSQPQGVSCGGANAGQLAAAAPSAAQQAGTLAEVKNGVQEVALTVQGANYYPNPIRVKIGVPVKLVADMESVTGCSRSIVIPDFGVRKTVSAGDNAIEFTPGKSGTFSFSCSMGMYRGTIVVEGADGTVAATTGAAPKAAAGSCGSGSGGCGCGGARR